jgi:DNA repair protein RadA/Sms
MAKVKTTFSAKAVEHPMQNGKDIAKNGTPLPRRLFKTRKVAAETKLRTAPKPLKINEIDSTEEIRMDTTDAELNRVLEAESYLDHFILGR